MSPSKIGEIARHFGLEPKKNEHIEEPLFLVPDEDGKLYDLLEIVWHVFNLGRQQPAYLGGMIGQYIPPPPQPGLQQMPVYTGTTAMPFVHTPNTAAPNVTAPAIQGALGNLWNSLTGGGGTGGS